MKTISDDFALKLFYAKEQVGDSQINTAIWTKINNVDVDLTSYFLSGTINSNASTPVNELSATFSASGSAPSLIIPNIELTIYFYFGNDLDNKLLAGRYFIDRVTYSQPGGTIQITARNIIGKYLVDCSDYTGHTYSSSSFFVNLANFFVNMNLPFPGYAFSGSAASGYTYKFTIAAKTNYFNALKKLVSILPQWKIGETKDFFGLGVGLVTDTNVFTQSQTLYLTSNISCVSYAVEKSDENTYSRINVWNETDGIGAYADISNPTYAWTVPTGKILYVDAPAGTASPTLSSMANLLAAQHAAAGETSTYSCIFLPHIEVGDYIYMDGTPRGNITSVDHSFGVGGYTSTLTIESAGLAGNQLLTDYLTAKLDKDSCGNIILS